MMHRLDDGTVDGEIQFRGDSLFLGYREGEEITRPETSDGWFATRDKGFLDGDGYLHVNGRMDNMFIAGGENVQPESIEAILETFPSIQRAIVVPVAHVEFGASPAAFILWDQAALPLGTLKEQLKDLLPSHALPQHIFPWPEDIDKDRIKVSRRDFEKRAKQFLAQP